MSEPLAKNDLLNDTCPDCAGALIVRVNMRLQSSFVGCVGFPRCSFTRELTDSDRKLDANTEDSKKSSPRMAVCDRVYNGCLCEVCHKKQFDSPSGVTCENGHGGAGSIDIDTGEVTYPDEKVDWDGMAESMQVVDNQDVVPDEEGVNLIPVKLTYFKESGKYQGEGSFLVDFCSFSTIVDKVRKMREDGRLPDLTAGAGKDYHVLIETPNESGTVGAGVPHLLRPVDSDDVQCNQCGLDEAESRRLNGVDVGELCKVCWRSVITRAFDACPDKE